MMGFCCVENYVADHIGNEKRLTGATTTAIAITLVTYDTDCVHCCTLLLLFHDEDSRSSSFRRSHPECVFKGQICCLCVNNVSTDNWQSNAFKDMPVSLVHCGCLFYK